MNIGMGNIPNSAARERSPTAVSSSDDESMAGQARLSGKGFQENGGGEGGGLGGEEKWRPTRFPTCSACLMQFGIYTIPQLCPLFVVK